MEKINIEDLNINYKVPYFAKHSNKFKGFTDKEDKYFTTITSIIIYNKDKIVLVNDQDKSVEVDLDFLLDYKFDEDYEIISNILDVENIYKFKDIIYKVANHKDYKIRKILAGHYYIKNYPEIVKKLGKDKDTVTRELANFSFIGDYPEIVKRIAGWNLHNIDWLISKEDYLINFPEIVENYVNSNNSIIKDHVIHSNYIISFPVFIIILACDKKEYIRKKARELIKDNMLPMEAIEEAYDIFNKKSNFNKEFIIETFNLLKNKKRKSNDNKTISLFITLFNKYYEKENIWGKN